MLKKPHRCSIPGQEMISAFRAMFRQIVTPITTRPSSTSKRRLDRGMRISADHPSASVVAWASQKVLQPKLGPVSASLAKIPSVRTPAGVIPNTSAVWRSMKVSRLTTSQSLDMAPSSRRRLVARIPEGSESYMRPAR
jgi:hypothetical protein